MSGSNSPEARIVKVGASDISRPRFGAEVFPLGSFKYSSRRIGFRRASPRYNGAAGSEPARCPFEQARFGTIERGSRDSLAPWGATGSISDLQPNDGSGGTDAFSDCLPLHIWANDSRDLAIVFVEDLKTYEPIDMPLRHLGNWYELAAIDRIGDACVPVFQATFAKLVQRFKIWMRLQRGQWIELMNALGVENGRRF